MWLYFLIYFGVFLWYNQTLKTHTSGSQGVLFAVLMGLALFVGMGDMLGGYDRYVYCDLFDRCADCMRDGRNLFVWDENPVYGYNREMSYVWWNILVSHVTENRYIFILLTTIAIYLMLFLSLRQYITNYPFALLIFLSLFYFFTYTYLRQVMAVTVAWFAYRYVLKRKIIPFLLLAYVAYKFHHSALVFFPLYFVPLRKYPKSVVLTAMAVLLVVGLSGIPNGLYMAYGEVADDNSRAQQNTEWGSTRYEYFIEAAVFLYFIMKRYDEIPDDPIHLTFLNASLLFCAILLFFVQSPSGGRQSWYYIYGLIFTLEYLYTKRMRDVSMRQTLLMVLFLLFIRIVLNWSILLYPYKTFLTDGYRPNDPIHAGYEYDENYDKDKFYRKAIDFTGYDYGRQE